MTMRRPTDRTQAWADWRARINGAPCTISTDEIMCGFYKARRQGRFVGVQIDLWANIDPDTGELIEDEKLVAFVGPDTFFDLNKIHDIWLRCGGQPISEAEFERLERMPAVDDLTRAVIV